MRNVEEKRTIFLKKSFRPLLPSFRSCDLSVRDWKRHFPNNIMIGALLGGAIVQATRPGRAQRRGRNGPSQATLATMSRVREAIEFPKRELSPSSFDFRFRRRSRFRIAEPDDRVPNQVGLSTIT